MMSNFIFGYNFNVVVEVFSRYLGLWYIFGDYQNLDGIYIFVNECDYLEREC